MEIFKESIKIKESVKKEKKTLTLESAIILFNGRQKVLSDFESGIFPIRKQSEGLTSISDHEACLAKVSNRKQLEILTPKQMFQRLPVPLAQVKASNFTK